MGRKRNVTLNEMKSYILERYPNSTDFKRRVMTTMRPNQIVAIYRSLLSSKKKKEDANYHQMDIWEWMVELNRTNSGPGTHTKIRV